MTKEHCQECFSRCDPSIKWICPVEGIRIEFVKICPVWGTQKEKNTKE